jgi:hypothetical protein
MKSSKQFWLGLIAVLAAMAGIAHFRASQSLAADEAAPDLAVVLGRSISTKVVTLALEDQRGEPRLVTAKAKFDRPVQAYWVAVVGSDIKFQGNTEKYINRQMFAVDPFAKLIDGTELEVSGKLGIRDGSGDWDDSYDGTITVAVTAVLAGR